MPDIAAAAPRGAPCGAPSPERDLVEDRRRGRATLRRVARSSSGESVLTRAVRILEVFTPEDPALPVSEIARRASLHVATASRLVAQLTAHGLLARQPDGRIRIGVRLWELAF